MDRRHAPLRRQLVGPPFLRPDVCELDEADWSDPEELEGIPDEQQDQQVQPAGAAVVDDRGADRGGIEVGHGQQHGGDAP